MRVTVKFFGGLRELANAPTMDLTVNQSATVEDVMQEVEGRFPTLYEKISAGVSKGYLNVLVDGRNIRTANGLQTELSEGTAVAFLPPVGGG